jgi:hypothetical protein
VTAGARLPRRKGFETTRPPDVSDDRWQAALRGLSAFVAGGWADQAEALGWTRDELFAAPLVWSRVDLCGVGLLIGDREIVGVTPNEIRIKTASGRDDGALPQAAGRLRPHVRVPPQAARGQRRPRRGTPESSRVVREYQRLNKDASLLDATRAVGALLAAKGKQP